MPVHNERLTSIVGMCKIVCHLRAFEIPIYWGQRAREARKRGEAAVVLEYASGHYGGIVGRPDDGDDFERGLYITLCYERSIQRVVSLDIQLSGR